MTTSEFLSSFGAWLLDEPVHKTLLLLLGALQILLWIYMLVAYHFMRQRLISVELRHGALIEKIRANAVDLHTLQSREK